MSINVTLLTEIFNMKRLLLCVVMVAITLSSALAQTIERDPIGNTIKTITYEQGPSSEEIEQLLPKLLELEGGFILKEKFDSKQKKGVEIKRYDLVYNNRKIEHGSVAVMIREGQVACISANLFHKTDVTTASTGIITESVALQNAMGHIGAEEYIWQNVPASADATKDPLYRKPQMELVYVQDFYSEDETGRELHFAYKIDMYATKPLSRDNVYVDAFTGKVLLKDAIIKHVSASGQSLYSGAVAFDAANTATNRYELYDSGRKIATYDLHGSTILSIGNPVVSNTPVFSKSAAVDAHWGATVVYEYWKNKHNRISYDGAGTELSNYVNYFSGYNNAFWNGASMVYGNGTGLFQNGFDPLTALDVCAHEVGHGVCQATSALVYAKESGAMNEGFSDIWGAVIEHYAQLEKDMWRIGEEIGVDPLRVMSNPNLRGDPDTYGGLHWEQVSGCSPTGPNDNCGVHTNSGVLNYWFYLLVTGGKGKNDNNDSFTVAGIGVDKAAEIAYTTEQLLSATATYADCRTTSVAATAALYGNCSREAEAVIRAWHAVGVGAEFIPCAPQLAFAKTAMLLNKDFPGGNCPSSVNYAVPMKILGNAPSGGNATVTISAAGNAVNNVDYKIITPTITVNAGDTSVQQVVLEVFDNADTAMMKEVKLYFTIAQNGSNLSTSYTFDTCLVLLMQSREAPDTAGNNTVQLGVPNLHTKVATPFQSARAGRMYFITDVTELYFRGLKQGVGITAIQFYVTQKNSVRTFENFTVKLGNTTLKDLTGGMPILNNTYYNDTFTTQAGWNTIKLSTPFVPTSTGIAVEICHTNSVQSHPLEQNDYVKAMTMEKEMSANVTLNSGFNSGCSVSFTGPDVYFSSVRPVVRFLQPTYETQVETGINASRDWDVHPGQHTYFRNELSGKLIMSLNNAPEHLGCTNGAVTRTGSGFRPVDGDFYKTVNRSYKEFAFTPTNNNTSANPAYDMALYFDTSEMSAGGLGNIRILATTAPVDSMMNVENTEIAVPVMEQRNGYTVFKANFTGNSTGAGKFKGMAGRYFITDDNFTLKPVSVAAISANTGNIRVRNNPFRDKIYIDYSLVSSADAHIVLYDITGKQVAAVHKQLSAGQGSFEVNANEQHMPPGNYILKVITETEVMTAKLVKQ